MGDRMSEFNSRCRTLVLFRYVTNQPPKANSSLNPSGVGKWVPASAGKAKASVSGCTRGVQVKLWDPLRTHIIPERLRDVFTTRRYTNPRLPLPLRISFRIYSRLSLDVVVKNHPKIGGVWAPRFREETPKFWTPPFKSGLLSNVWKNLVDSRSVASTWIKKLKTCRGWEKR